MTYVPNDIACQLVCVHRISTTVLMRKRLNEHESGLTSILQDLHSI